MQLLKSIYRRNNSWLAQFPEGKRRKSCKVLCLWNQNLSVEERKRLHWSIQMNSLSDQGFWLSALGGLYFFGRGLTSPDSRSLLYNRANIFVNLACVLTGVQFYLTCYYVQDIYDNHYKHVSIQQLQEQSTVLLKYVQTLQKSV